jgi:hypothetical protein
MATTPAKLERGLGLKEAAALNMIDMVGIGPFIVIPLVIKTMNGPQCILAWVVGALLALADGSVWAELEVMPFSDKYIIRRRGENSCHFFLSGRLSFKLRLL